MYLYLNFSISIPRFCCLYGFPDPSQPPVCEASLISWAVVVMDLLWSALALPPVSARDEWAPLQDGDWGEECSPGKLTPMGESNTGPWPLLRDTLT